MQKFILNKLDEKGGRLSTRALLDEVKGNYQSFYRALNGLQKRDLILWYKGDLHSSGLVTTKRKTVLLVDVDLLKMNLALIKISAHHKKLGHDVVLQRGLSAPKNGAGKFDFVYISCILRENAQDARRLAKQFPSAEAQIGGCGINLTTELPPEIENIFPDYDLYQNCDYSLGYCTRGCPRSCEWCVIPAKEGKVRPVADIYQFYDRRFSKIIFLDNNILAVPKHFEKIVKQVTKEKLICDFQQAMDIRLVDDDNAKLIKKLKFISFPRFSWDNTKDEYLVMRGIEILRKNGVNRSIFYVLCGYDSTFEEDLYRVNKLRDLGQTTFVMIYDKNIFSIDIRYKYLRDWSNARTIFFSCTFEEYVKNRETENKK